VDFIIAPKDLRTKNRELDYGINHAFEKLLIHSNLHLIVGYP